MDNNQEKSIGVLIVKLIFLGIAVLGAVLLLMGVILGWFKREAEIKKPALSQTSLQIQEGEKYTLEITNYHDLGEPPFRWAIEDREVASVRDNKDGTAEIVAKAPGTATVSIKAENCEELQCSIVVTKAPIASIAGSAWETEDGDYFFLEDGSYYYFVSPRTENYIKGTIQIKEMTGDEMLATEAAMLVNSVERAAYFKVDTVADLEIYYGSRRRGSRYTIYVAANEEEAAIYDSGWSEAMPAKKIDLQTSAALDGKFPGGADIPVDIVSDTPGTVAATYSADDPFTVPGADFTNDGTWKESVNAIQIGNELIFKRGDKEHNALYRMPLDGSGAQPELVYEPADGRIVTIIGTDGQKLLFGEGDAANGSYGTDALYRMDVDGYGLMLLVEDAVSDFCVYNNYVFYTDYSRLVKLSMTGKTEVLWDYGVYCYEITADDLIFLFDSDVWELLDTWSGEDFGYLCESCNQSYECDIAEQVGDYLYYLAYDYDTETVSLRALDIQNGAENLLSPSYTGTKHDTYCVLFSGKYAYFTTEDGESLVRFDVTSGAQKQIYFDDLGYWYANEIIEVDGQPLLYLYDEDGNGWYVSVDESMNLNVVTTAF
ncbi:MAG: hypothetical protein IKQ27_10065 [Lachnospiraceae bacterium]|nr:hypothetical protein [Lachnospiraceae bacterium]